MTVNYWQKTLILHNHKMNVVEIKNNFFLEKKNGKNLLKLLLLIAIVDEFPDKDIKNIVFKNCDHNMWAKKRYLLVLKLIAARYN